MAQIMYYGIISTPGVVVDGEVVHAGGVPDKKKLNCGYNVNAPNLEFSPRDDKPIICLVMCFDCW